MIDHLLFQGGLAGAREHDRREMGDREQESNLDRDGAMWATCTHGGTQ
jgi:hypothetical protein